MNIANPSLIAQLLLDRLETASGGYALSLFQYVRVILIALALLDLIRLAYDVWTSNQGPDAALPRLGRWILYMCAVAAIVQTSHRVGAGGDSIARYVYDLFREWGERASGTGGFTPASIFQAAIEMAQLAWSTMKDIGLWNPLAVPIALLAGLVVLAMLAGFGYLVFLFYFLFLEWFVALSLAPAFLVTAAHKWTAGIAEGYVSYLISLGYRTLAIFFCYPVLLSFVDEVRGWYTEAMTLVSTGGPTAIANFFQVLCGSLFAAWLCAIVIAAVRAYANRVAPQGRVLNLGSVYESI
ncbi:type IV secretion system protein [Albidovulum sp.]|uniref:type IV secretion system protein n=1 Tax=Albidovulum sp. TaxID=1872424 RepID=UPI0025C6D899|nr:type IV secretion system protein [Defluviimonas sp.]